MSNLSFSPDQFFKVPLSELVPERVRPFPLYLYFELNQHLILIRKETQELEEESKLRFSERGVPFFWCPNDYQRAWDEYRDVVTQDDIFSEDEILNTRSEEAAVALDLLLSPEFSEEEKKEAITEVAKQVFESIFQDSQGSTPEERVEKCLEFAQDVIKTIAKESEEKTFLEEVFKINQNSKDQHSIRVSSFTVLFCMSMGIHDPKALASVTLGSLTQDAGFVKIDATILQKEESQMSEEEKKSFMEHPKISLELLSENQVHLDDLSKKIIEQHHENFDGSGYPKGLKGDQISMYAQISQMALRYDEILTGKYDKKGKEPREAFESFFRKYETELSGVFDEKLLTQLKAAVLN